MYNKCIHPTFPAVSFAALTALWANRVMPAFQSTTSPEIAALTSFGLVPSPCAGTRHIT